MKPFPDATNTYCPQCNTPMDIIDISTGRCSWCAYDIREEEEEEEDDEDE